MTDKGFNLFDQCSSRCVHLSPQEEESPLLPEVTVKCAHMAA